MSDESDDDKCNCIQCYKQPSRSFRIKEGIKEPANAIKTSGLKRGFLIPKKTVDDSTVKKQEPEVSQSPSTPHICLNEHLLAKQKPNPTLAPDTFESEKMSLPEIQHNEVKMELKCTKCSENNDTIDLLNQGAFRVSCSDGCTITMHRNCFEKTLGSGKKKELKSSAVCPCEQLVTVITHRIPGRDSDFVLWLRCEGKEVERPKKEDKVKEVKKKEIKDDRKEKDNKYKKDRREEDENRKIGGEGNSLSISTHCSNSILEERPLTPPLKRRDEEIKKNLVKPLPADLLARPIEKKEDALMSKYTVKEATKEATRKKKKEVKQVILPGLTVRGQRGKKDEEDDLCYVNEIEETNGNNMNDLGMENNDLKYEEGPYGFAMPEEVCHDDYERGIMGETMTSDVQINNYHNQFHHPLPIGHGVFRPLNSSEPSSSINGSFQPLNDHNGHNSLSGFTESPAVDEPPLIENPFDYPNLEKEWVRERKDLINFFETHTPVLEENAALFDSTHIDLEQLMNMLENFIEFQFYGNEEEKRIMTETLHAIFVGEVENDIIPFLIDLQCFKYGYVDGRLVVSVKTEGRQRREREEDIRREREEQERRLQEEEDSRMRKMEEDSRKNEEKKREEVRRVVMELEERRRREVEERRLIDEESIRMEEERQRKRNEEKKKIEEERRLNEEAKAIEKRRLEIEEQKIMEKEEVRKIEVLEDERKRMNKERDEMIYLDNEKKKLEEKKQKEDEIKERRRDEIMDDEEEMRLEGIMLSKKDVQKKRRNKEMEKELERKTREAINSLRKHDESKSSSSEPSPERKQLLKCVKSSGYSSSSIPPLPPSSSSSTLFSSAALPFVPKHKATPKAELIQLNPNAPAFIPSTDILPLFDENGTEVDEMWIDVNKEVLKENRNTIEELNRRIAELEAEKIELEMKNRLTEMEIVKKDGMRINEDRKNNETICKLEEQIQRSDTRISQILLESEKKSAELNQMERDANDKVEEMKSNLRDYSSIINSEQREKENALEMISKSEEARRKAILERKTGCAKEAVILSQNIVNKLATEAEAQVMTSLFIDLRRKWTELYTKLKYALNAYNMGESIDWEVILSLKEPSMPREANELVKECYVWHYQTMHSLSFRLAGFVKRCLSDHGRYYEDAFIIGVIQKWMKIHKDPTKIDATVPQVANMVCIALGDLPLMPAKYVYITSPSIPSAPSTPSTPSTPTLNSDRVINSQFKSQPSLNKNDQPKGWKKASDKVRQVDRDHECSICLEDTEGGDISYCEQISCNEPYHNDCLDRYWKTGGRFCPRCRTPMPPRDAYPALG